MPPTYRITRLWSVAGFVTTEMEAESEDAARAVEKSRWDDGGAVASLPPELRQRVQDVYEEIDIVEQVTGP